MISIENGFKRNEKYGKALIFPNENTLKWIKDNTHPFSLGRGIDNCWCFKDMFNVKLYAGAGHPELIKKIHYINGNNSVGIKGRFVFVYDRNSFTWCAAFNKENNGVYEIRWKEFSENFAHPSCLWFNKDFDTINCDEFMFDYFKIFCMETFDDDLGGDNVVWLIKPKEIKIEDIKIVHTQNFNK